MLSSPLFLSNLLSHGLLTSTLLCSMSYNMKPMSSPHLLSSPLTYLLFPPLLSISSILRSLPFFFLWFIFLVFLFSPRLSLIAIIQIMLQSFAQISRMLRNIDLKDT